MRVLIVSWLLIALSALPAVAQSPAPSGAARIGAMSTAPAGSQGPVRNLAAQSGEEITTLRYWKIRKGSFPEFLNASQQGIWPFFEKIGARIIGMWMVVPPPGAATVSPDFDEVYLATRYAGIEHWEATRDAAALGGDGPDYAALQEALALRQSLTIETHLTVLKGVVGPMGPYFMPGSGERFQPLP
jgi:hypothetical protein